MSFANLFVCVITFLTVSFLDERLHLNRLSRVLMRQAHQAFDMMTLYQALQISVSLGKCI